jgi:hypothetical protein
MDLADASLYWLALDTTVMSIITISITQWRGVPPSDVKTYGALRTAERSKQCVESRRAAGSGMLG